MDKIVHLGQIVGLLFAVGAFLGACISIAKAAFEGKNWYAPLGPSVTLFLAVGGISLGVTLLGELAAPLAGTQGILLQMYYEGWKAIGDIIISALKS